MPATRIVTQLPLQRLWDDHGDIAAQRERFLSRAALRELLRQGRVAFYVAEVGRPLRRGEIAKCYDFWKSEVAENVVNDPEAGFRLEDLPGEFAYVASDWSGGSQVPIVLLEKHH